MQLAAVIREVQDTQAGRGENAYPSGRSQRAREVTLCCIPRVCDVFKAHLKVIEIKRLVISGD